MMKNKIYNIFQTDFQNGQFIKVGDNKEVNLYVGYDEYGRFALDYRGKYKPSRIVGSSVISVVQLQSDNGENLFLRFSLDNSDLLDLFCIFCEDLIESTNEIKDDQTAYKTICDRFFAWKKLFKPHKERLTEYEIMGLIGELLFLKEEMIPLYGIGDAIVSWTGVEKTHKDFSIQNAWYEIKTITNGKESVRISSIEQLDSDKDGFLVIYSLEKMSPTYNGLTLNQLVKYIMEKVRFTVYSDLFITKLDLIGYDYSPEYDNYVYEYCGMAKYNVTNEFPRLKRDAIPIAITKIQYEIILSEIISFKQ